MLDKVIELVKKHRLDFHFGAGAFSYRLLGEMQNVKIQLRSKLSKFKNTALACDHLTLKTELIADYRRKQDLEPIL